MKVAYFAHNANLTGANRSLIDLTSALKQRGVDSVVFLPWDGPIEEELKTKKIKYHILPYKRWFRKLTTKNTLKNCVRYILSEMYNFLLALKTAKSLKKEGIELVHSNTLLIGFGAQVAAVAGLPHVWHIREFMEEDHNFTFRSQSMAMLYLRKANALVAISDVVAEKYSKKIGRNITIIYNGVDIKKYSIPDKRIFENSKIELMIAGRIVKSKGQKEAVEAVELLKKKNYNVHLRIIGDGTSDGELEKIQAYTNAHNLDDIIEYIPFQIDMSAYNLDCDIQLVCSHSEAFGRVTVEGMLSHSLVIGADAGCTPYLLEDGVNGLLYICGDPQSLADKIEWAINHKNQAQEIANAGYEHGKQFSIDLTSEKVCELYSQVLSDENIIDN